MDDFQSWAEYQSERAEQAEIARNAPPQEPEKPLTIKLHRGLDLYKPQVVKWLVRGVVEAGVLMGAFGAPASGKSFAAVDLSLCICSGKEWHGHKVKQGAVVYFAGEGQAGLRRRLAAWVQCNPEHQQAVGDNFYLAERVCHLPDELPEVLETLGSVPNLSMVVLDTLQRTMTGDENSTRDMSAYIQSLDSIKTAYPELTIMVIHHTGHGASDRARGSSVLKASLDTEVFISKDSDGVVTVGNTKMKDAEPFKPLHFRLDSTLLDGWLDDDGEPVTSAVLQYLPDHQVQAAGAGRRKASSANQLRALTVLRALQQHSVTNLTDNGYQTQQARVSRYDWQTQCIKEGIAEKPNKFIDRIQIPLVSAGAVRLDGQYVIPVDY